MAKPNIQINRISYGIYTTWNRESKALPKVLEFTRTIPARVDIEFGYIVNIKKGKGKQLHYCIDHPRFADKNGEPAPPFTGYEYIRTNNWHFFLGDTIWEPVQDKVGTWRLTLELEGRCVADESFTVVPDKSKQ